MQTEDKIGRGPISCQIGRCGCGGSSISSSTELPRTNQKMSGDGSAGMLHNARESSVVLRIEMGPDNAVISIAAG
jgi:hypothetical protein